MASVTNEDHVSALRLACTADGQERQWVLDRQAGLAGEGAGGLDEKPGRSRKLSPALVRQAINRLTS